MTGLADLSEAPRWVAWRNEERGGKSTKLPYAPQRFGKAQTDDPKTWGTLAQAKARAAHLVNGAGGGTGIVLGDLGDGTYLGGIDLDSCLDEAGTLAPWAAAIVDAVPTYAERSPSGKGLKAYFRIASAAVRPFLDRIGVKSESWGSRRTAPGCDGADHGPAIEIYLAKRYFAVTDDRWPGASEELVH